MKNRCGETRYVPKGVNRNLSCVFLYVIYWNCVQFGTRGFHVTVRNLCSYFAELISDLVKKQCKKYTYHMSC